MENQFHLIVDVEPVITGDDELYHFVIRLHSEQRSVEIAFGDLYGSKRDAAESIPPVLTDKKLYEDKVAYATWRALNAPNEAYKVFAFERGNLRSPQDDLVYRIGALYAYPIVESLRIGIEIHPYKDDALDAAHHEARRYGVVAVVRCNAGNVENVEGTYVTDALVPLKIEKVVLLSPVRMREDGVLEEWDHASMDWRSTNAKYEANPYHEIVRVGEFSYILQNVYRCP